MVSIGVGAAAAALRDQTWIFDATLFEDSTRSRLMSLQVTEVKPHQTLRNPVSLEYLPAGAICYWSSYCSGWNFFPKMWENDSY